MRNNNYSVLVLFYLAILFTDCPKAEADWFDDFESANVGDAIGSLGYTGNYVSTQVSTVGVGGSQGFEITPQMGDAFPRTFIPVQPGLQVVGDTLTFQIDMQMRNASLTGGPSLLTMLDLTIANSAVPANQVSGGIVREGTNWSQYRAVAFASPDFDLGSIDSVAELGLNNNETGAWSDWVTLQLLVSQTGVNSFDMTSNILDSSGAIINTAQLTGVDLSDVFSNGNVLLGFGHFSGTWQISDRFRFDNVIYSIDSTAVPEPSAAYILAFGLFASIARRRLEIKRRCKTDF